MDKQTLTFLAIIFLAEAKLLTANIRKALKLEVTSLQQQSSSKFDAAQLYGTV